MPHADDHLTTGWEADVPEGDSLLRRALLHTADLTSAIARAAGGTVVADPDLVVADLRRPSGYWDAATLLAPPSDWHGLLDRIDEATAAGRGTVALWSAWPTPDLRTRGWELSGHPPLLVRPPLDVVPLPPAPAGAPTPARVRREAELAVWEDVVVRGYPMAELAGEPPGGIAPAGLLHDDRFGLWTSPDGDGIPVAAAMSFTSRGLGTLAMGATLPDHRRSGHWRALATARLATFGPQWAAGIFSDDSRPGAERLGFVPVLRLTLWLKPRS